MKSKKTVSKGIPSQNSLEKFLLLCFIVIFIVIGYTFIVLNTIKETSKLFKNKQQNLEENTQKTSTSSSKIEIEINSGSESKSESTVTGQNENANSETKSTRKRIYRYGEWHEEGTAGYYYELGFDKWSANRDWQGAKVLYAKALEVDPNYTRALCSYGYIIGAFENQFTKGEEYIQKGMQNDPTWAYCPFNLGILKDLQGNWPEAKKWMEFTVTNFANHPDIGHFRSVYSKMKEFHGE